MQGEGILQGSVRSVTLFGLAINDIVKCLSWDINCTLYVDDFSIFYSSHHLDVAERHIQLILGRITHWAESHGFQFSLTKTVTMHFTQI